LFQNITKNIALYSCGLTGGKFRTFLGPAASACPSNHCQTSTTQIVDRQMDIQQNHAPSVMAKSQTQRMVKQPWARRPKHEPLAYCMPRRKRYSPRPMTIKLGRTRLPDTAFAVSPLRSMVVPDNTPANRHTETCQFMLALLPCCDQQENKRQIADFELHSHRLLLPYALADVRPIESCT